VTTTARACPPPIPVSLLPDASVVDGRGGEGVSKLQGGLSLRSSRVDSFAAGCKAAASEWRADWAAR
jgi:hypothetical protein